MKCIDMMLEPDPGDKGDGKCEVEKPFVGYSKDYECRRKCEEYNKESVKVVPVRLQAMQKRY